MLNLFINYDCNLSCDYCFAKNLGKNHPLRIGEAEFERFCKWLEKSRTHFLGILGGEPTVHPLMPQMLERLYSQGITVALFTNALYKDEELTQTISACTANIVVNCNDPGLYTKQQVNRRAHNLDALTKAGAHISFSKNFSPENVQYEYLLDYCRTYGVTNIRYDVSRPSGVGENRYFSLDGSREVADMLLRFVRECEENGILTGLDCPLPACLFEPGDLEWLREHSMRFEAVCQPSLDVHTDLSVSYCLPLHRIMHPDVTETAGEWELLQHFASNVRPLREQLPAAPLGCGQCRKFGAQCQGGCLALREPLT